jgi:hypothetical protein
MKHVLSKLSGGQQKEVKECKITHWNPTTWITGEKPDDPIYLTRHKQAVSTPRRGNVNSSPLKKTPSVFVCDALSKPAIIFTRSIKEAKYWACGFHGECNGMVASNGMSDYTITEIGPLCVACMLYADWLKG